MVVINVLIRFICLFLLLGVLTIPFYILTLKWGGLILIGGLLIFTYPYGRIIVKLAGKIIE